MAADLIHWMHTLFLPAAQALHEANWAPAADVYHTRSGWLVKFDLAGVRPEEIQVEVQGRRLTVRGTRRDWCLEEGCRSYQLEISYSDFARTLEFPVEIDSAPIATEYQLGMLLVQIRMEANNP